MDVNQLLTPKEISSLFADPTAAEKFPLLLNVDEAAALARVPKQTIYTWSSQGRLVGCSKRVGKHLRIVRDKFFDLLMNRGINEET